VDFAVTQEHLARRDKGRECRVISVSVRVFSALSPFSRVDTEKVIGVVQHLQSTQDALNLAGRVLRLDSNTVARSSILGVLERNTKKQEASIGGYRGAEQPAVSQVGT